MSEAATLPTPEVTRPTLPEGYPTPPIKLATDVFLFTEQCRRPVYSFKPPSHPRITFEVLSSMGDAYRQTFHKTGTSFSIGSVGCEGYGTKDTSEDNFPKASFPGEELYNLAHKELLATEVIYISTDRGAEEGHGEAVSKMIRELHPERRASPSTSPPGALNSIKIDLLTPSFLLKNNFLPALPRSR